MAPDNRANKTNQNATFSPPARDVLVQNKDDTKTERGFDSLNNTAALHHFLEPSSKRWFARFKQV